MPDTAGVKMKRGTATNISAAAIDDGSLVVATDTGELFADVSASSRVTVSNGDLCLKLVDDGTKKALCVRID